MHPVAFLTFAFAGLLALGDGQTIDPSSVPMSERAQWCTAQKESCPLLCSQVPGASEAAEVNDCEPSTLLYDCVCSNGNSPNASQYSLTIPYFECTRRNDQCVQNCGSNNECARACREDHPCGAQKPKRVKTTSSSTMAATATSEAQTTSNPDGFSDLGGSTDEPSGASATALNFGQTYGLAMVLMAVFAGFSLVL
ncbi:MAG: hypothetical protein M1837_007349 [Sclerophora amabilis]|nr:MAG: hypothetical protein M1837_007349 [Sclerophora amabilis]